MKKVTRFALTASAITMLLCGCMGQTHAYEQGQASAADRMIDTQTADTRMTEAGNSDESYSEAEERVILTVFSDLTAADEGNPGTEYALSERQSAFLMEIFYHHEMKTLDSPRLSIATIEFRIGRDVLCTSKENLSELEGIINGEYVLVVLHDSELQRLQEILGQYVEDLTQLP